jgi:hypothetical protein
MKPRKRPARWNQRPRPNTAIIAKAAARKMAQRLSPSGIKP